MRTTITCVGLSVLIAGLSGCIMKEWDGSPNYNSVGYQSTRDPNTALYPESYDAGGPANYSTSTKTVVVPESYHVGSTASPTPPRIVDRSWVGTQDPKAYTIELANDEKPLNVANIMSKAPKNERTAELKSQHDGKTYYMGLYGSYPDYEAAKKALEALPNDVRQGAGIKQWGAVQDNSQ